MAWEPPMALWLSKTGLFMPFHQLLGLFSTCLSQIGYEAVGFRARPRVGRGGYDRVGAKNGRALYKQKALSYTLHGLAGRRAIDIRSTSTPRRTSGRSSTRTSRTPGWPRGRQWRRPLSRRDITGAFPRRSEAACGLPSTWAYELWIQVLKLTDPKTNGDGRFPRGHQGLNVRFHLAPRPESLFRATCKSNSISEEVQEGVRPSL